LLKAWVKVARHAISKFILVKLSLMNTKIKVELGDIQKTLFMPVLMRDLPGLNIFSKVLFPKIVTSYTVKALNSSAHHPGTGLLLLRLFYSWK
jgi:hypothetical protein